jgi:dTDP-4-amino-4,6-dideoxygalactose transaminase
LAQPVLEAFDMVRYFKAIVANGQAGVNKPDGRHLTYTIEASGGSVDRALMVGDSITDLQAALGISQLERLPAFVRRRREIAHRYDEAFAHLDLRPQVVPADSASARHLYIIHTESKRRDALFSQLRAAGIGVNVHYAPVHLQPYYRELGFTEGLCPNAEAHGREAISLPVYADLDASQQDYVITTLVNLLKQPLGLAA